MMIIISIFFLLFLHSCIAIQKDETTLKLRSCHLCLHCFTWQYLQAHISLCQFVINIRQLQIVCYSTMKSHMTTRLESNDSSSNARYITRKHRKLYYRSCISPSIASVFYSKLLRLIPRHRSVIFHLLCVSLCAASVHLFYVRTKVEQSIKFRISYRDTVPDRIKQHIPIDNLADSVMNVEIVKVKQSEREWKKEQE